MSPTVAPGDMFYHYNEHWTCSLFWALNTYQHTKCVQVSG